MKATLPTTAPESLRNDGECAGFARADSVVGTDANGTIHEYVQVRWRTGWFRNHEAMHCSVSIETCGPAGPVHGTGVNDALDALVSKRAMALSSFCDACKSAGVMFDVQPNDKDPSTGLHAAMVAIAKAAGAADTLVVTHQ